MTIVLTVFMVLLFVWLLSLELRMRRLGPMIFLMDMLLWWTAGTGRKAAIRERDSQDGID